MSPCNIGETRRDRQEAFCYDPIAIKKTGSRQRSGRFWLSRTLNAINLNNRVWVESFPAYFNLQGD